MKRTCGFGVCWRMWRAAQCAGCGARARGNVMLRKKLAFAAEGGVVLPASSPPKGAGTDFACTRNFPCKFGL